MKVLHVIAGLPARAGGPTNAAFGYVQTLIETGVDAEIATTDSDIWGNRSVPIRRRVIERGVPVYYFHSPALRKYGFSPGLARWLRRNVLNYDIVEIHGLLAHSSVSAANAAVRAGVPYVLRPTGQLGTTPISKNRLLKRVFMRIAGRRMLDRAAAIHATTLAEAAAIRQHRVIRPIVTVPLGTDAIGRVPAAYKGRFRSEHPELNGKKIVLFLSRLDAIKGLDLLFPAVKLLRQERSDFALVLAGSGRPAFEAQVKRWVADYELSDIVVSTGFVQGDSKLALLADADVFVLPSYHENFGVAVVEAMAMAVPVVVSDQVALHNEISESRAGIAAHCDRDEIAAALRRLLADDGLRECMGQNGRRLVAERFTWPMVGESLSRVYDSVLSGSSFTQDTTLAADV